MAGLRMAAPLSVLRSGQAEAAVGPLLALFSVGSVAIAVPAGRLSDRRGYHLPVALAVGLTVLGALLAFTSTCLSNGQYFVLCAGAFASGAGGNLGLITIQRSAGRSAHDVTELRRVFSWLGIAPSFSNFVGPLSAGLLIDRFGFRAAFGLLSVLPFLSLIWARWVPREAPVLAAVKPKGRAAWDLLASPLLRRLLLVNWLMSASWDVHSFLVPVLGNRRGLSASLIGSVLGAFALAVTTVRLLIPILANRLRESQVLVLAMLVVSAAFAVYPLAFDAASMIACASVLGLALGASQPMVMTALHRITPPERQGEALALRSLVMNSSSALMPLGFGALGAALGVSGLFWSMAVLVGSGVWVARSIELRA